MGQGFYGSCVADKETSAYTSKKAVSFSHFVVQCGFIPCDIWLSCHLATKGFPILS
uniref:Uncharacterized protein n=1 Tax=Arundo donax TaxID=35708 RepID=A0A0A9F500_ARUDO